MLILNADDKDILKHIYSYFCVCSNSPLYMDGYVGKLEFPEESHANEGFINQHNYISHNFMFDVNF